MLDMTTTLLVLMYIHQTTSDKKEFKKKVVKLLRKVQPIIKTTVLDCILLSPNPRNQMLVIVEGQIEINRVTGQLLEAGAQGMVIHYDDAYPVTIEYNAGDEKLDATEAVENFRWAVMNQKEINLSVAHACMNTLNLKHLNCVVIMFKESGFVDTPDQIEIEPGVESIFARKVGRYFAN